MKAANTLTKTANSVLERLRDEIASTVLAQRVWARYEAAPPRDQLAVKVLGGFLAAVLLLTLVILPLHRFNGDAIADYRAQQDTLAWMQNNRGAIGAGAQKVRSPDDSLLTLATRAARGAGINVNRYEPSGDGLNIWLERVPFNQLVQWLDALQRDYGIVATDLTASKRDAAGMVDVRVTLKG